MKKPTYTDITHDKKKNYRIDSAGKHVFFLYNRSGELNFTVAHPKARLYVFGLYEGAKNEKLKLSTTQKHTVPGAKSTILIKGIFRDRSSFNFDGIIKLDPKAQKTEAFLENRNLLLSDKARVTTEPALEIYPDNVICTHAATVSQIDPEHVHYLQTRGIDPQEARKVLTQGFIDDLITQRDDC